MNLRDYQNKAIEDILGPEDNFPFLPGMLGGLNTNLLNNLNTNNNVNTTSSLFFQYPPLLNLP